MRIMASWLLALVAVAEGIISIPVKWSGDSFLGVWGGGWLKAASVTLLLAIFLSLDDLRGRYQRTHE
jgi:hypothetical protein